MKAFKIILIAIPVLFILWIIGMFNGLKLVPFFKEDYYIGSVGLDRRMSLMYPEEELTVAIPALYGDTAAIDLDIFPSDSSHRLTINKLVAEVMVDGKKLDTVYHYVYTSFGEVTSLKQIVNFPVGLRDSVSTYVEARYVYDLGNLKKFTLHIEADYLYDDNRREFNQSFEVEHTRKLTWRGMNWGGKN